MASAAEFSHGSARGNGPDPRRLYVFLTCLSAAFLAVALLVLTLRLDQVDLRSPLNYLRDANTFLLRAKSIVEGNWVWFNPRVGMPFGADWRDFPMNITLDSGVMWLLSRFTSSPALIVNLEWMIAVGLAAALACYAFARLGFQLAVSASFGAIFALLPYTYFRGTQHLHCVDYAVPLAALPAIEVIRGAWITEDRAVRWRGLIGTVGRVPVYAWIGCLLAGLAYVYTAFFAVFVLLSAGIVGFLRLRDLRPVVLAAALAGAVAGVTLLDLSPSVTYWARNGPNAHMLFKSPAEAELYALKVRYLITPVPNHPIPAFREAEERLAAAKYPLFLDENEWGRLGTIGSIGFLYLIVFTFGAVASARFARLRMAWLLGPCAALTLASVLFASVGGFGDFFSTFISPDIRCYARIFPFIGFFSVAAAAALFSPLDRRLPAALRGTFWVGVAVLAAYDQAVPSYANDHRQAVYRQDADFVRYIDTVLPENSAIFELPYTDFPNEILPARLMTNDLLRPYLHSAKYRWSWPAVSGTMSAEWNRLAASLPAAEMLKAIAQRGFSGLWLDTAGYEAGQSPEAIITKEAGVEPRRSRDGRFLFYDLRTYAGGLRQGEAAMPATELLPGNPVQALFERGFYYAESGGGHLWHWSLRRGRITLVNPLDVPRKISLSMDIRTADPGAHSLRITWPGGEHRMRAAGQQSITIALARSEAVSIDLVCDCPGVNPPGAARRLYFSVSDVTVKE